MRANIIKQYNMRANINKQYKYLIFIYIISFVLVLLTNEILKYNNSYSNTISNLINKCFLLNETKLTKWLTKSRGKYYYTITENKTREKYLTKEEKGLVDKKLKYCLITLWAVVHIGLYIIIGFLCPNLFIQSFFIGAMFELYEKYAFKCHDSLDVIFNSIGFGIGYMINKFVK
jgi:uncharacterized Tic20 family protein